MAEAMATILTDRNLAEDLMRRGLEQARQFSWEKTAVKTIEVYESVVGRR
jgi:glycosyltransferase involved in cell wall biosynthesis